MPKILQLTDIHLLADPKGELVGLNTRESFEAVLTEIHLRGLEQVDAVILTGDLIQNLSEHGGDRTTDENAYKELVKYFEKSQSPVYWIPGNHDHPDLCQQLFTGGSIKQQRFIEYERWQIVLLDSHKPGRVEGCLSIDSLAELKARLALNNKHTLLALHHHPIVIGCRWLEPLGLENADEFWQLVSEFPQVQGVVWGHIHQEIDSEKDEVMLMATPSTSIQFTPKAEDFTLDSVSPGFRVIELHENGTITTEVIRASNYVCHYDPNAKGY